MLPRELMTGGDPVARCQAAVDDLSAQIVGDA